MNKEIDLVKLIIENLNFVCILLIVGVFFYFLKETSKLFIIYRDLKKITDSSDILSNLTDTKFDSIKNAYKKSINILIDNIYKTNIPSSEYFSVSNVCKAYKLNLKMLDIASSTLIGLGLLGTFFGLTMGISGIDITDAGKIMEGIEKLLAGTGTAFYTSLAGMSLSIVYSIIDKSWYNKFSKQFFLLSEKLDELYYIDDITLQNYNQKKLIDSLYMNLKTSMEEQILSIKKEIEDKLSYINENGDKVKVSNAVREILTENQTQSKALNSLLTDILPEEIKNLVDKLNSGFDLTLSNRIQNNISPLINKVDKTTLSIVEHIDGMANKVSSPATEMIEKVVSNLKDSMSSIIEEFNKGLSGSATKKLEDLASQLGTVTEAMADFPKNMKSISNTFEHTIEEVKNAISEISKTSANANSTTMKQMQEQISFATKEISKSIIGVQNVMNGITQNSQEQSNQMVNKLAEAAEKMGTFLNGTITSLSSSVKESVKNIVEDVNDKQADLIELQEGTTNQTRKLLETFNVGLERLEKMNEYISNTMNMFQQAQGQITGSTAHLHTITGDMKQATQLFNNSQTDYRRTMEEITLQMESALKLLKETGNISDDYVNKFDLIKEGLGSIFAKIQAGLREYSTTVQNTTGSYLEQYSSALTDTVRDLSTALKMQQEVVDTLADSLKNYKRS